ncbi:MAG: GNAT family N-acetyltransferase, partial [Calditrichaeota bacterium]|nr:GNAT family N-acetyltransferase [Calditrichota bacterium]
TERLILRGFELSDAAAVRELVDDIEIARTTCHIPHPYTAEMAQEWISGHQKNFEDGISIELAITLKSSKEIIGAIGISSIDRENEKAEIGYWIGKKFWNQGYCSEAAKKIVEYCFEDLKLNRVYALHFAGNPVSGRVMEKIGMRKEGVLRKNIIKWGEPVDTPIYSILREEYEQKK